MYSLRIAPEAVASSKGQDFSFTAAAPGSVSWITGVSSTFSPDLDKVREAMERDDVTGDKGDNDNNNSASLAGLRMSVLLLTAVSYVSSVLIG